MYRPISASRLSGFRADRLGWIALDSLRSRVCVLDSEGTIVLTNHAWDQFAQANRADLDRCGPGVNYLEICKQARGPFSELAMDAGVGIAHVLGARLSHFILDYPCPSPSRPAWHRLTARPLREVKGGAVIAHSDITAQTRLTQKLGHLQATYDVLAQSALDPTTVVAADGTIEYQIPASHDVFGYRAEELAGRNIGDFVHPEDAKRIRNLLQERLRSPHSKHHAELRFRNRDGSWRIITSVAQKLPAGPADHVSITLRDITQPRLAERVDELARLTGRLFRQQEEQHRWLAGELHEGLGRRVATVALQASHLASSVPAAADGLRALQETVSSLNHDLHNLAHGLYPPMLDHLGLAVALREYVQEFGHNHGIRTHYTNRGIPSRLKAAIATTLYRVAQSALDNVAAHAKTDQAWVTLTRTLHGIRLAIRDEGAGFDPAELAPGAGLGIAGMRQRMAAVNGSLSVRSRPGAGTAIVALAPLSSGPR